MKVTCIQCGKKSKLGLIHAELKILSEDHFLYLCRKCRTLVIIEYLKGMVNESEVKK